MAFSSGFSDCSLNDLLKKVPEEKILNYYFGITQIPCIISAPYRQDSKPSVGIYVNKNGKIQFTDFGTKDSGGVFDLLMKTWGCNFQKCIDTIVKDFDSLMHNGAEIRKCQVDTSKVVYHKSSTSIQVKFREWRDYDIEFWETYGISLPWLEFGDIHPISRIFYTKDGITKDCPADKYAYVYIERKDGVPTFKIYQPFSETTKWISKHNSSVWDLWTQLPEKGNKLIITSSRKDALCIWENTGIPAISLQGEGYFPKEQVIRELKNRFEQIYVLYDNDYQSEVNNGREFGKIISDRFYLTQIEIPSEYKAKDPSDLCKKYGRQKVNEVISKLMEDSFWDLPF